MKFFEGNVTNLISSVLTKNTPAYVQFYVTARCNLACEQCNIIYANADQEECSLATVEKIAKNLSKIGVSTVLLTGGEPFIRKDIVDIAEIMIKNGVHPRIQTNGLATIAQLEGMSSIGAHDISISLDTLMPELQDQINGDFDSSWERAMRTIANVNNIFPKESFAVLGCVIAPRNFKHVSKVIKFATEIGWWVSLVPAHVTKSWAPRSFSTYDTKLLFQPNMHEELKEILEDVKKIRNKGANLYDSDEYLDDIYRFLTNQEIRWRDRNNGVCDSPNLYFAIQPNGEFSPCCDFRIEEKISVGDKDFPQIYKTNVFRQQVGAVVKNCSGCMYGSYPEVSITARNLRALLSRTYLFGTENKRKLNKLSYEEIICIAKKINDE